ncbi:MAG TPA: hypothetical protein VHB20_04015 [Verrucomicrobiae bacterium]|jgi:Zn finger protein HypA/HybF involved in hydrogenase expression|nr:hypothetical protein [Verrucomicrobiae bacterium]
MRRPRFTSILLALVAVAAVFLAAGCKKEGGSAAIESDANGYLCLHCGAKIYTDSSMFLGAKCPKCHEDTLRAVVGYLCPKDHHVTIRTRTDDTKGPVVCDLCGTPLVGNMVEPHAADLVAWGAGKGP